MPSTGPRGAAEIGSRNEMETVVVAAGLMVQRGRVLLAQRREEDEQGLLWEFPGGKVEEGEEPRQALEREIEEELGMEVAAGELFDAAYHFYPSRPILLLVYRCRILKGLPRPLMCRDLRWASPEEMRDLAMPAADEPIRMHLLFRGEDSSDTVLTSEG